MFPLDDSTVERIAEVIVDMDGPYERKGYQLEALLKRAGWSNSPDYDGSYRVGWLTEHLVERRENREEIERVLCRVCDPIEYDDGMASAEVFREVINTKLESEGLVISYIGGRPVIGVLESDGKRAVFSVPENLDTRLRKLIRDPDSVDLLMNRVNETLLCEESGAHTMAIIGIGSFVEGLLYSLLMERDADFREHGLPGHSGRQVSSDRVSLQMMIDVAHAKDWIQLDAKDFMHKVRDYRNFVHPRKELAEQPKFDRDSVTLCWAPVRALLNDLEEHVELANGS